MLFRRRTPAGIVEKLRVWIWPRRSWVRSSQYVSKRIFRLTGTPHAVAAGVAAGVFASFTPFLGFHFALAFLVAYLLAGNMIAAALGTFIGNPLTFPVIWASTYAFGRLLLGQEATGAVPFSDLGNIMSHIGTSLWHWDFNEFAVAFADIWHPLLKPMAVGGIPLGILVGLVFYIITRRMAVYFHSVRQRKLLAKANKIRARTAGLPAKDDMARRA